jgi:hypothetical protein
LEYIIHFATPVETKPKRATLAVTPRTMRKVLPDSRKTADSGTDGERVAVNAQVLQHEHRFADSV